MAGEKVSGKSSLKTNEAGAVLNFRYGGDLFNKNRRHAVPGSLMASEFNDYYCPPKRLPSLK